MKRRWAVVVLAAVLSTLLVGAATAQTPYCGITWGSLPKSGGTLSPSPLTGVRTGQHPCYDRVVFDINGPANGYRVSYASQVLTQGQGLDLGPYTAHGTGGLLSVTLLVPAYDLSGHSTFPHRDGDHVANVLGYRTLRDVVYGGSFEGYTTFAVGVRARLPFRVFVLGNPTRIVLDVAHQWTQ